MCHATKNAMIVLLKRPVEKFPGRAVEFVCVDASPSSGDVHGYTSQELMKARKERKGCNFDWLKNRPGTGSQPSAETQRVWMSFEQLFAVGSFCLQCQLVC